MNCIYPYWVYSTTARKEVPVPCNRCPPCKKRRVDSWAFRLMQQDKVSTHSHFVTLTYDTLCVPITQNGFMTFSKRHLQLFFKRLRKSMGNTKIKYYVAAEYSPAPKLRPHYHAIIFNVDDPQKFSKAWGYGGVHIGNVQQNSVAYTMKYIDKPSYGKQHVRDDRMLEFSLKSSGLGLNYLTDRIIKYHKSDLSRLFVSSGGFKIPLPAYYRRRIYSESEMKDQIAIVQTKMDVKESERFQLYKQYYPNGEMSYDEYLKSIKLNVYHSYYQRQKLKARKHL